MPVGDLPSDLSLGGGAGLHGDDIRLGLVQFLQDVKTSVEDLEASSGGGAALPLLSMTQSAPQAIPEAAPGLVEFDLDRYRQGFPVASPVAVSPIPTGMGGPYEVAATVTLDSPTPGNSYSIRLLVDGSPEVVINSAPNNVNGTDTLSIPPVVLDLAESAMIEVDVEHNEGADLNTVPASTYLSIKGIAADPPPMP